MFKENFECSCCGETYSGVPCNNKGECTSCAGFFEEICESGPSLSFMDNLIWWSLDKQTYFLVFFVGFVFGAVLF